MTPGQTTLESVSGPELRPILSVHDPIPFPVERVRKYKWYARFRDLAVLLQRYGVTSPVGRAVIVHEVEKVAREAAMSGHFGGDKYRTRAAALLVAELKAEAQPEVARA